MLIKVRYFASLKESVGRAEEELVIADGLSVAEVWNQANKGMDKPSHILAAVNMEYVDFNSLVYEGDEVAFFPPVTGG